MQTETTTSTDIDFDWNEPEEIDDNRAYWKWYNLQNCGKAKWSIDPATGKPVISYFRRCNQAECPKCQARKRKLEERRLGNIDRNKVKYCEVDKEDEANLTRKYGKDKIRRIPLEGNRTAFIIETTDTLPNEKNFTIATIEMLVESVVSSDSRRPSGNLGKEPSPAIIMPDTPKKEVKENDEYDWDAPEVITDMVTVKVKECTANFDSDNPNAPKDVKELFAMMHSEVEIERNPLDHRELWDGVNKMQAKLEEICKRYDMSFRCIKVLIKEINLYDVNWDFTLDKRKPE